MLQSRWNNLLDTVGDDPFCVWFFGTNIIFIGTYWIFGGLYTFIDIYKWPKFIRKYKIQPQTNETITAKQLFNITHVVLFNQLIVGTFVIAAVSAVMTFINKNVDVRTLPTFTAVLLASIKIVVIQETLFYFFHRLLHHRLFYKRFHKKHHEWTSPIAITTLYCTPMEYFLTNLLPPAVAFIVSDCHVIIAYIFVIIAIFYVLNEHSGYHLPFMSSSEFHDFHHLKFDTCYGVFGFLDWLLGTDEKFRKHIAFKRHIVLFNTTPARELFPD